MVKNKPSTQPVTQKKDRSKSKVGFMELGSLFEGYELEDKGGYITREFQDYGYRLAIQLDDMRHKSLYIKLSKNVERGLLEEALSFVSDAPNVKNKGKLFMWKLNQLKEQAKNKSTAAATSLTKRKSSEAVSPTSPIKSQAAKTRS